MMPDDFTNGDEIGAPALVSVVLHEHRWEVSAELLADETARRVLVQHIRANIAPTGRLAFRRYEPNPIGVAMGNPPALLIIVERCMTAHEPEALLLLQSGKGATGDE